MSNNIGPYSIVRLAFPLPTVFLLAVALVALVVPSLQAQAQGGPAEPGAMPFYGEVLGEFSWPIKTGSGEAQEFFDQGIRMMFAFTPADARRSFVEARHRDPECAMCWWGEAWSVGPYLNGAMRTSDEPAAWAAAERARTLAGGGPAVERALIEAMAARYSGASDGVSRRGLDSTYVRAMAEVYREYPGDLNVATLYADALMLLEPRRGLWPLTKPSVAHIHEVLEGVLSVDLGHPGACHLYIHATETTEKVYEAQACADLLGASIPGASHINHMPSHTYNRVGRWGDAMRANIEAWHSDLKAERGEGFAIYPSHNLHMLLFSASMDGQGAIAMQAANDYTELVPNDGASFQALTRLRFGRFDEVLELVTPPNHPIHRGLWAFARGYAHLRAGATDSAHIYLERVDSIAREAPETQTFRVHQPAPLLGVVSGVLRGEMLHREGRVEEAVRALREAEALEAGLTYDEPEPLPFTVGDYLGAVLLESGRFVEAEEAYRRSLERRPNSGWSLVGLEDALRMQGREAEADAAEAELERAWTRSDTWLPTSRF